MWPSYHGNCDFLCVYVGLRRFWTATWPVSYQPFSCWSSFTLASFTATSTLFQSWPVLQTETSTMSVPLLASSVVVILHSCVTQDWWTSTSFSSFYRKWNTLIHDWIRAYIYQDFKAVSTLLIVSDSEDYCFPLTLPSSFYPPTYPSPIDVWEWCIGCVCDYICVSFHTRVPHCHGAWIC